MNKWISNSKKGWIKAFLKVRKFEWKDKRINVKKKKGLMEGLINEFLKVRKIKWKNE